MEKEADTLHVEDEKRSQLDHGTGSPDTEAHIHKDTTTHAPLLSLSSAERKLLWKCDLHVVPILFLLFLLAFLDRTNIGNARIQGLEKDLNMDPRGNKYNIALLVFFVPYILFEVPSNLIIKRVAPSTWLSAIMVLWGIATMGQGLINNFGGLVAMRLLVGLFEAGLFPGCIYLISM